ncbi:MAG TPA: pyridoxal 5'-phosphate synthase glutaminase subunit PdxT [Candidatus Acidoferrales bacterium]|nr:pyridoxal 5'-phosphate synthase glutaminase subunit PdxT [Candidatus Acidoferrales bacterium]
MTVGILALQGDFEAHARMLERLGVESAYIKRPEEFAAIDALIIPGGESSTFLKFLEQENFLDALRRLPEEGKPLFGTCAGAILLAKEVTNPAQPSLGLVDITIERNAYGRQLASAVRRGQTTLKRDSMEMVFIRAPIIRRVGPDVQVLATCDALPVCVEEGLCLVSTFHPELTAETTLHEHFLQMVAKPSTRTRAAAR